MVVSVNGLRAQFSFIIAAFFATSVLGKSNLYTGWTQKVLDNEPYQPQTAEVGDTVTFIWTDDENQNVFIHPTGNCDQTGRIAVGNINPTTYTFTEDDASPDGKEIFFACDIDDRCEEQGMSLTVTVFPSSDGAGLEPSFSPVSLTAPPIDQELPETEAPTPVVATNSPTKVPSKSPTSVPVAIATSVPTTAPVVLATAAPVIPTSAPVIATNSPTKVPSKSPTSVPTVSPTPDPTRATDAPVAPVPFPTVPPTPFPTRNPTLFPTTSPPIPTNFPTTKPVVEPVAIPTEVPTTTKPVDEPASGNEKTIRGLQMTINGITSFAGLTKDAWEETTETFLTSHYEKDFPTSAFKSTVTVTNSQQTSQRRLWMMRGQRRLQAQKKGFVITYNQEVSYDSDDGNINDNYLAKSAFASPEQRDAYVQSLKNSGDPVLETATDATKPIFAIDNIPIDSPVASPTLPPTQKKTEPVLSMAAIIGIACGGGALLIIIILFLIYCTKKGSKENENVDSNPPPMSVSLKEDEVSTLAGPSIAGGGAQGEQSVGTVDYDYTKAYGNGDTSVSSAGGTFGSNTQNISLPANAGATGAALGTYGDDGSYDDHFRNSGNNVKEEILHIFAPPGKLGVVIDTPDDGAPVVHAVKDSSVVVDKVQVGDKLVAVDDEDVRTLTAIKVSKLISRKSANPSRKLTILRTTLIE